MAASSPTAKRVVRSIPFAAPHVFVLAVVEGPDLNGAHRIARSTTVIGRGPGADWTLGDDEISKQHCTIRYDAGLCHVVDAASLNGTTVNDRPLRRGVALRLRHLDEIQLGGTRLLFLIGRFAERPPKAV